MRSLGNFKPQGQRSGLSLILSLCIRVVYCNYPETLCQSLRAPAWVSVYNQDLGFSGPSKQGISLELRVRVDAYD